MTQVHPAQSNDGSLLAGDPSPTPSGTDRDGTSVPAIPIARPLYRWLRAYAFDPSLSTQLETAVVNHVTIKVPWEYDPKTGQDCLQPGPVGEYLEVVDFDPASNCFYAPVDLNNPYLLARDGIQPSEGNPQFHQQMVYAVAMTTIRNFERALGRVALWAPHRWQAADGHGEWYEGYVQRLRIYPHALREANAYYSPSKKALLFGYFPACSSHEGRQLPGGTIFTCLSHDIIAHETTHALLDGLHRRFTEPTNPDVLAFHEAFADIVALFQHFSFPDVLRHQIAKTRGDLSSENLLGKLAQEFGDALGSHGALRDALGGVNEATGSWERSTPDPARLHTETEPHARGALLVAAIFDAFVTIYQSRVADLLRIATNGTGILAAGSPPPDLVNRLAAEAAKSAQHLLTMCIRALDYCPPVDLTFGDYLRALITADYDLVRDDKLGYRVAIVEAFRRRGIYPHDVRSLAVDSLIWTQVAGRDFRPQFLDCVKGLRDMREWALCPRRKELYETLKEQRINLHRWWSSRSSWITERDTREAEQLMGLDPNQQELSQTVALDMDLEDVAGVNLSQPGARFEVHSLRPVRRIGPNGEVLMDLVIEILQKRPGYFDEGLQAEVDSGKRPAPPADFAFRGGCTLIVDAETSQVRYSIIKRVTSEERLTRQRAFLSSDTDASLHATYFQDIVARGRRAEPFAFLHRAAGKEIQI